MPNPTDTSLTDKKVFTVKNVGFVILSVFSCASAWGALSHRIDRNNAVNELQDNELKKIETKLDKKVYNSDQLTYRLNSGQTKIIGELSELIKEHSKMIHEQEKNNVRESAKTDYMLVLLKELKAEKK
tara:strand:+ start:1090 stop:1473 length:384 start_codon:yes stop_codon:yes gene_type:complete